MNPDLEQQVLDATAKMEADTGREVAQGDVVRRLVSAPSPLEARRAFDNAVEGLIPRYLTRGGMPATPALQLTAAGWLRSSQKPDVARLAQVLLETYRTMASSGPLQDRRVAWPDLVKCGMNNELRGLLHTAGSRLHLFSGSTLPNLDTPPDSTILETTWDVDELVHLPSVEAFFEHRIANPPERVNYFHRLRQRITGEIRRCVDEVHRAKAASWPPLRKVQILVDRKGDDIQHAIDEGFAIVLDAGRPDARIGLTYRGLWLARNADQDRALVLKVLRGLAKAYIAAPVRERIPASALVDADIIDDDDLEDALRLLEGQTPQIVIQSTTPAGAEFLLGPWLLRIRNAGPFDDLVYSLGRAEAHASSAGIRALPPLLSVDLPEIDQEIADSQWSDETIVLGEKVGAGAQADIYVARDLQLDRKVAVKVARDTDAPIELILNHARAFSRGSHPAIVRVFGVRNVRLPHDGTIVSALVMEYVGGDEFGAFLAAQQPTRATFETLANTLVDAVASIHEGDGCHGDLHPGNVKIVHGNLRLLDLYHRPSLLYSSTKTLADNQAQDRRETRDLVGQLLEKSQLGPWGSVAYRAFTNCLNARPLTLESIREAINAALSAGGAP